MRKLKMESLNVESFETTAPVRGRGTVNGHIEGTGGGGTVVYTGTISGPVIHTYDVRDCGESKYFDCTYGCTMANTCPRYCSIYEPAEPIDRNTISPTIVVGP